MYVCSSYSTLCTCVVIYVELVTMMSVYGYTVCLICPYREHTSVTFTLNGDYDF